MRQRRVISFSSDTARVCVVRVCDVDWRTRFARAASIKEKDRHTGSTDAHSRCLIPGAHVWCCRRPPHANTASIPQRIPTASGR